MADIYDIAAQTRARVLAGERDAAAKVLAAYADSYGRIQQALNDLLGAIEGTPTEGQLVRLGQYADMLEALAAEAADLAALIGDTIQQQQAAAYNLGAEQAQQQVSELMGPDWHRNSLPTATNAAQTAIGLAGNGSPLHTLLNQSGQDIAEQVKGTLVRGIIAGRSPRDIARDIRDIWGVGATRALATARTEVMRAYREGNRHAYEESGVVSGWEWVATKSARTCPACLALDGRIFPLDQPLPAHVNCRCTCAPVVKGRDPDERTTGATWLAEQDEATQRKVLGPKGYEAYKNGAALEDFLHWRHDESWGKQAHWKVAKP